MSKLFLIFILVWALSPFIAIGAGTCMDRMGKGWV